MGWSEECSTGVGNGMNLSCDLDIYGMVWIGTRQRGDNFVQTLAHTNAPDCNFSWQVLTVIN